MTAAKRYRRRTAKPGQLIAYWGKLPGDSPDVLYAWGAGGASKADAHLIHSMLSGYGHRIDDKYPAKHDGYLNELEARGYDLTTLRFSVERKAAL